MSGIIFYILKERKPKVSMESVKLILNPKSGLGNRMRAISSFIYFKTLIDADLEVVWIPDSGLNIRYQDLFQPNPSFKLLNPDSKYNLFIRSKFLTTHKLKFIPWMVSLYNISLSRLLGFDCLIMDRDIKKGIDHLKKVCRKKNKILVITGNQCVDYQEGFRAFVPIDQIAAKIKVVKETFKDYMIGIHIRKGDHKKAIQNSPNYLFENKIDEYLEKKPKNFGVFLATDDSDTASFFTKKYPEIVFSYPKIFSRNSREGMMDAVVELFLLAGTKKIYGSYWSSFSGVAKRIYGTELEILHR